MHSNRHLNQRFLLIHRRGAAVVEAALILPILIIITLGAIDISQYINLAQLVANASREGANVASHNGTESVQEVEAAVLNFMMDCFPRLPEERLAQAFEIQVRNGNNGEQIPGGKLPSIEPGEPISVRVSFDFSVIRWIQGPSYWDGNVKESITFCRRE